MSIISITIDTDNDAFQNEKEELNRIFRTLCRYEMIDGQTIRDCNGNECGHIEVLDGDLDRPRNGKQA